MTAIDAEARTRVVHVKHDPYDVYIGRAVPRAGLKASKWANPFKIGRDGDRDEVLQRYREYVLGRPELIAALPELRGKVLGCWCAPEPCHGDVLVALLAATPDTARWHSNNDWDEQEAKR